MTKPMGDTAFDQLACPSTAPPANITNQPPGLRPTGAVLRLATCQLAPGQNISPAQSSDWDEEYLRLCIAISVVRNLAEAIAHINQHSTKNSEAIVTRDEANAREFLRFVDSATVYWNASTRFTDGAEFGFGAEMGVSTQKLHCRGPFALAELTSPSANGAPHTSPGQSPGKTSAKPIKG